MKWLKKKEFVSIPPLFPVKFQIGISTEEDVNKNRRENSHRFVRSGKVASVEKSHGAIIWNGHTQPLLPLRLPPLYSVKPPATLLFLPFRSATRIPHPPTLSFNFTRIIIISTSLRRRVQSCRVIEAISLHDYGYQNSRRFQIKELSRAENNRVRDFFVDRSGS